MSKSSKKYLGYGFLVTACDSSDLMYFENVLIEANESGSAIVCLTVSVSTHSYTITHAAVCASIFTAPHLDSVHIH